MARLKKTEERPPAIRWLIRRDMEEVLEIEKRSFQFPWTEEEFIVCLRQRNCIGTVYESSQGYIHGFMLYELHQSTLHLLNIAVAPEVRGTGVGRAMVQRLVDKLSDQKRRFVEAEVRETNLKAQLFFSAANCGCPADRHSMGTSWIAGVQDKTSCYGVDVGKLG